MIFSIWRYSHLTLAISSFCFLLLASLTGGILAIEPIFDSVKAHNNYAMEDLTLGDVVQNIKSIYDEAYTLEVDSYDNVFISAVNKDGVLENIYINPNTAIKLGNQKARHEVFNVTTNLHRSLFLKSTGRLLVGIASFLLVLIAGSGIVLLIKRQKKWYHFFSKTVNDGSYSYYHSYIGKLTLFPILIIALSGVYLSLEKFSLLPEFENQKKLVEISGEHSKQKIEAVLQEISFSEVESIEFPFSEEVDDYYIIKLSGKEVLMNQYTGSILEESKVNLYGKAFSTSYILHTGQGSVVWSILLFISCFSILFFIYSGTKIFFERRKNKEKFKNTFLKNESTIVILVGSETGSTFKFAILLFKAFLKNGEKVFLDTLNNYSSYSNVENLIVMTATYGDGIAPNNAVQFVQKLQNNFMKNKIGYSVLGFGSKVYPNYCAFAERIENELFLYDKAINILPLYKINEQSFVMFQDWCLKLGQKLEMELIIEKEKINENIPFKVISKTEANIDKTFLLRLKPNKDCKYTSGDLLGIQLPNIEVAPRYYSIAKIGKEIHLSIKKHEFGVCSNYLATVALGTPVFGSIKKNDHFHINKQTKRILFIANGTGIAPFVGMVNEVSKQQETTLFLGLRRASSLGVYQEYIEGAKNSGKLNKVEVAYSKDQGNYVQSIVEKRINFILDLLQNNGCIMICGSIKMKDAVLDIIESHSLKKINVSIMNYTEKGQIKTDCY
ncbi:PepSY domain-containing protein [Flavicella sp.]|uniref:PepSY domain-containing protein n=1 Tax=Flavicella sp. TaxID=2957742 RepID=UPI003016E13C